ncbi:hypothetical protein GGX14DRAFT_465626 [Mycena pura]|uniref:Uncharacterized protein n=1 Tax=Mycena pura TaxID=153505 RepID=A0AAD6V382_9AGAR|nr:hypothetical protein GGX14DRAFT_465626 [Mycena pura]
MLDDSPSLTPGVSYDQVKLLAAWMEDEPLATVIDRIISSHGAKANKYVDSLQIFLRDSPVRIDSSHRKSQDDMRTLWSKLKSEDYPYARFLLEMWEPSKHTRQPSTEDEIHAWLLDEAFGSKFEGDSVDLFCATMKEYASGFDSELFYGRIIAWHGPSGAGKSKGVDALKDRYPVYSICFRSSDDPSDGWPPGDTPAYNFFATCESGTGEERVAAFLGAFLEVAVSEIEQGPLAWKYRYKVGEAYVNSARGVLFTRVAKRAEELLHIQINNVDMELGPSSPSPAPAIPEPEYRYQQLWRRFCQVPALALIEHMPTTDYCFIALDECIDLPNVELMALRHILEAGHNVKSLWFILLSTNAEMHSLQQTYSLVQPSARFARLQCLPAWCHFGFGQLSPPEPDTPRECLRVDYLRKVGRPLFATYKTAMVAYSTARKKLFSPQPKFNPGSTVHILAAFSHRILLDLGSTVAAHTMAADSVKSNLRYATRIDGEIVHTVCPSEPLLSLIAADALNKGDNYVYGLRTLVDAVKKAELYCRLIIIRARDPKVKGYSDGNSSFSQTSYMHIDALVHLKHINPSDADRLRRFASGYHEPVSAIPQTLLRSLFIRGAGVQCCHGQPVIDGFYVAYGGDLDKPFDLNLFIMIPWQSKAKAVAASQAELVAGLTGPMQIDTAGRRCKPAQLVIVMDFNAKPASRTGNRFLQVTKRKAKPPTHPKKPQGKPITPWGGYAMGPHEEEPMTWCLDIRGHGGGSYPCTKATAEESSAPDFSALFEQVGRDIVANSIIAVASRSADACLHPLYPESTE